MLRPAAALRRVSWRGTVASSTVRQAPPAALGRRQSHLVAAATIQRPLGSRSCDAVVTSHAAYSNHPYQQGAASGESSWRSSSSMLLGLGAVAAFTTAAAAAMDESFWEDSLLTRLSAASQVTLCDDTDDVVEDDPYDNLPEKDEPTHCSICLTYRQGPCRPYWKKVEACTKDHEVPDKKEEGEENEESNKDDENGQDPPCLKYMMPWIDCASGFRNLYALIEMDTNYTEGIADLEATAANELCWAPQAEPSVDWSAWQDYVELLNPEWKLPKDTQKSDGKQQQQQQQQQHFWQSLDHSKDLELVQVEAQVPTTLGEGILECAYALDQNGDVIGFAYGTKPSEAAASKDDKDNGDDKKEEDSGMASMTIRILPTITRHVVLAASYTHVNEEKRKAAHADKDGKDDGIESHIVKSRPLQLDVVADRNTKVNIAA